MSSDDDDFIAIAHYNKSLKKPEVKENNSDDEVPVFSFNKPKLKSFGFANKLSTLIRENKPFEEDIPIEPPKIVTSFNSLKSVEPLAIVSNNVSRAPKRDRDIESDNVSAVEPEMIKPEVPKKIRVQSPISAPPAPSEPKTYKFVDIFCLFFILYKYNKSVLFKLG